MYSWKVAFNGGTEETIKANGYRFVQEFIVFFDRTGVTTQLKKSDVKRIDRMENAA